MKLTAPLIEAFSGTFLSPMYDEASPTPPFHRAGWELYCSPARYAALAAPRAHAKSTAFTHDYGLAAALFRDEEFFIIVSATEDLAIGHLGDIAKELRENDDLRAEFGVKRLIVDAKTDLIVEMDDGHQFRFLVRGAQQKMRGLKWNGKRPGMVLCDDLEEDEQVESYERRRKFKRWFNRALIPCIRRSGKIRMHGTILHEDSLLANHMKDSKWESRLFKAHHSFDDFSEILWPERYDEEWLKSQRQIYINDNDPAGYSQEYLNDPFDNTEAYLRREDFLPMTEFDWDQPRIMAVGVDFAISKKEHANRTSFTVGGKDAQNLVAILDERCGRWNALEIIDMFFTLQDRWAPDIFWVENGQIWNALSPILYKEMQARDKWININARTPIKDKATRGRAYQRRHAGGGMRFNKEADWYPGYEAENLRFTGRGEALADDQFDSTALLMLGFETMASLEEEDFESEEEEVLRTQDPRITQGRSSVTGY